MSTNVPLSDATIDATLERLARRVSADGLRDAIVAGVAGTPQARPPLVARPYWLRRPSPTGRLVRVVAVAGMLMAMLAGSLYVGSQIVESQRRHPAPLVPTGVETLAPESASVRSVVADPSGIVWADGEGLLTRFDPASGDVRTWSYADDAAFGGMRSFAGVWRRPRQAVPARGGGVWLLGGDALRWFDGERFRDVVPLPPGGSDADHHLAEAPDGSLWVGTDAGLFRWDGTAWSPAPAGRPASGVSALAVDGNGVVWAGSFVPASEDDPMERGLGMSRYDGTTWETVTDSYVLTQNRTRIAVGPLIQWIGVAPDGSIWVRTDYGLASYDGREWTRRLPRGGETVGSSDAMVTWGPDGAAWVAGLERCGRAGYGGALVAYGGALVARSDGVAWTDYRAADGLPETCTPTVAATPRGVFAGTDEGVYRLVGDRWEPAWGQPGRRPYATSVVAISHDEAWAIDGSGRLWHYAGGAWSSGKPGEPGAANALVAAPGGGLVAATPEGIALLRDGTWTMATTTPARLVAVGADGTVRYAGPHSLAGPGEIGGFRLDDPGRALPAIPGPPIPLVDHLAVGPDGSLWAGRDAYGSYMEPASTEIGLFRYRDGRWQRVLADSLERPDHWRVDDLAVTPNGDVWVAWDPLSDLDLGERAWTRFDGATWTVLNATDGPVSAIWDLAVAPDGVVWAATADGLARYDGTVWSVAAGVLLGPWSPVAVAADGTVFVTGPSGLARITDPGR